LFLLTRLRRTSHTVPERTTTSGQLADPEARRWLRYGHWETGADNFIEWWHKADRGELDPFVLVVEGSIPNGAIKEEGY
jgi:hypothetical protein